MKWTAKREKIFLDTLAECGNVREAARQSELSSANAYKRRKTDDAFRAAWAEALREGYVRLETLVLDCALNGVEKAVVSKGEVIGTRREFSPMVALALMRHHRAVAAGGAAVATATRIDSEAALDARLSEINHRLGGAG